ncbi:MAG TPA: 5'/3'-nucleotidase SurE [Acidimicrobiia bacterium]
MRILLTNDDGIDAPALVPFARSLEQLGDVAVVVPDRERSWVGKAITRFDPVRVEKTSREGVEIYAVSGYPADAVQLGIHALDLPHPDLVVSGINLGYNHGTGFLMSSGTVGAAVEGWISGVPAVAVSTGTMASGEWREWRRRVMTPEERPSWERLSEVTVFVLRLIEKAGLHAFADVVSINLPYDATVDTERRVTTLARSGYDRLFARQDDGTYRHEYGGKINQFEAVDGSDIDAAHDGVISITPIRMPAAATVPPEVRQAVES